MPEIRLLGILGVVALQATASAKPPRHTRPEVAIQVVFSERTLPVAKPAVTPRPVLTTDAMVSLPWIKAPIRTEQQRILEDLIQNTSDSETEEKADYLFRLAELYAAQHLYWRGQATELHAAAAAAPTAPKPRADAAAADNRAKDFLLRSVKVYRALTQNDRFRSYPKMDQALFGYGYTLQQGKYLKEARGAYDQLLKNYPNSKYVPEAHLAFGEYYFDAGQLADAEARFKQVLKFPRSAISHYAYYKLGWIHLQLARPQEALESFFQVVADTRNSPVHAALNRAAALDFVRAYADIGKADKAYPAFQRVDPNAAFDMLELLAQLYADQGKVDRAIFVNTELMRLSPTSGRVCDWQHRIARTMLAMPGATNTDKVREIENLAKLAHALAGRNTLTAAQLQDCRANATAMSLELGRAYHAEAQKTRNPETLGLAVRLYQAFTENFTTDGRHAEALYLRAEALWAHAAVEPNDRIQRDRWTATSTAFAELAAADPQRAAQASRASVLAYLNGNDDPTLATATIPPLTQGRPQPPAMLSPDQQKLVDTIDSFAAGIRDPRDPELGALRFFQAHLYRRAHHHDKAGRLFAGLVATHPGETFSEAAAVLAIDSLILTQSLDDMLLLADRLAADPRYLADKPELAKVVKLVRSRSMRR